MERFFYTLNEAKIMIERWRAHYNTKRPHTSLGYRLPTTETIQIPNTIMNILTERRTVNANRYYRNYQAKLKTAPKTPPNIPPHTTSQPK